MNEKIITNERDEKYEVMKKKYKNTNKGGRINRKIKGTIVS